MDQQWPRVPPYLGLLPAASPALLLARSRRAGCLLFSSPCRSGLLKRKVTELGFLYRLLPLCAHRVETTTRPVTRVAPAPMATTGASFWRKKRRGYGREGGASCKLEAVITHLKPTHSGIQTLKKDPGGLRASPAGLGTRVNPGDPAFLSICRRLSLESDGRTSKCEGL